ncbi:MAG: hypothetical protein E6G41_02000 [Actinobacteria bacterium]|nr:MAG: hypothetical protein E6G41_02000 [Actinomycetota bacterium]
MKSHLPIQARRAATVVLSALALAAVVPSTASATKPVGECTQSYSPLTRSQWLDISPDAGDVFDNVNHNGDSIICFKYYPNGLHQDIYTGNLIDNTAAPHS